MVDWLRSLCQGLRGLPQADRGGGGQVQGLGAAVDRDGHPVVGGVQHVRVQPVGLVAEEPRRRLLQGVARRGQVEVAGHGGRERRQA